MPDLCQENRPSRLSAGGLARDLVHLFFILSCMQVALNLLSFVSDTGSIYLLLPLCALVLLALFLKRALAGSRYFLREKTLVLEKTLGDSAVSRREVPLANILSVRPYFPCEDLRLCYRSIYYAGVSQPLRVRLAFLVAPVSAALARKLAGPRALDCAGQAAIYQEGDRRLCLVFAPKPEFLEALRERTETAVDDRTSRPRLTGMRARALERAFPEHYQHVLPLLTQEDLTWAEEEEERIRAARAERKQAGRRESRKAQDAGATKKKKQKKPGETGKKPAETEPEGAPEQDVPETQVVSVKRPAGQAQGSRRQTGSAPEESRDRTGRRNRQTQEG